MGGGDPDVKDGCMGRTKDYNISGPHLTPFMTPVLLKGGGGVYPWPIRDKDTAGLVPRVRAVVSLRGLNCLVEKWRNQNGAGGRGSGRARELPERGREWI